MQRVLSLLRIIGSFLLLFWLASPGMAATLPTSGLVGTVKSSAGKAMGGVAVSARANGKTFTTSVYTSSNGEYYFPLLDNGQYRVWAQAVGFEAAHSETRIVSGNKVQQNFVLKPMQDFSKQLSGTEWANSLPEKTEEDRRLKSIFQYNCTNCHLTGFVLSKRFDAAGWEIILDAMIGYQPPTFRGAVQRHLLEDYKSELVAYLTRIRGPQSPPLQFKPLPRVTGEATEVVVTEYDIPRGTDQPNNFPTLVGSDWSRGIQGRTEGQVLHDAAKGSDGNVYFTDDYTPERTLGQLDPRTGVVTPYKLATQNGVAVGSHGLVADPNGGIYYTNLPENTIDHFDPKSGQFKRFPNPMGSVGRTLVFVNLVMDSKGNLWTSQEEGLFRLNPRTGEYKEYKTPTRQGMPYGVAVDSQDNVWVAQLLSDKITFVDARTDQISEIDLAVTGVEFDPRDVEIGKRSGSPLKVPPVYSTGPRRLGADPNGDFVWVAEFFSGKLTRIDINTKKVTKYDMNLDSHPYAVTVDKNHMVWIPLMNGDRIAKFNPFTETYIEYPLPSLGTNVRWVDIDYSTDIPSLWLPYYGNNKIAHVQFRKPLLEQTAKRLGN